MKFQFRKPPALLLLAICFFAFFFISGLSIMTFMVFPEFERMENREEYRAVEHCLSGINTEINRLTSLSRDWSIWDDIYQFTETREPSFIQSNISGTVMNATRLDLICITDASGQPIVQMWQDSSDQTRERLKHVKNELLSEPFRRLSAFDSLTHYKSDVLVIGQDFLVVASSPILPTNMNGPIRGAVIMGSFLSDSMIVATGADSSIEILAPETKIPSDAACIGTHGDITVYSLKTSHWRTYVYASIPVFHCSSSMILRLKMDRSVAKSGNRSVLIAFVLMTLVFATIVTVIFSLLLASILRRRQQARTLAQLRTKQLFHQEALLQALMSNMSVGIVLIDAEPHSIESVNTAAASMIGADAKDIIGRLCHQFICPAEQGKCPITDKYQDIDNSERELIQTNGKKITILKSVKRINIGNKEKLLESFVDIEYRKGIEFTLMQRTGELASLNREWQLTFDSIRDFVTIHDRTCTILKANKAFITAFGSSTVNPIGTKCYAMFHAADKPSAQCPHLSALKTGVSESIEFWEPTISKYLHVTTSPLIGVDGQIIGTVHVARDITERRQAQEAMEIQRNLAVFLSKNDKLKDGLLQCVEAARQISQLDKGSVYLFDKQHQHLNLEVSTGISPEHLPAAQQCNLDLVTLINMGKPVYRDSASISAIDTIHQADKNLLALAVLPFSHEGTVLGCLLLGSNTIHEIKSDIKTALEATAAMIGGAVAHLMAEEELRQARDAAEAATKAKSMFLAIMSHELRTPLNGVISMAALLEKADILHEYQRYAQIIHVSADVLLTLINDILDYSKIEARKLFLERITFDLHALISDCVVLLSSQARQKGLGLNVHIDQAVPSKVQGDPGRLRQVLTNLISNGIKFTSHGDVSIHAGLDSEDTTGAVIRFEISDTGIGIATELRDKLFQPFSQADSSITRRFGGTGLGLAIAKELVELMNGSIGFESKEGSGSKFWFTVVLDKQADSNTTPKVIDSSSATLLHGIRVLVVGHTQTTFASLLGDMHRWGLTPDTATSTPDAVKMVAQALADTNRYRIILVDQDVQEIDSYSLGTAILAIDAEAKLVILTSMGKRGEVGQARDAGFCGYLQKPVHPSMLFDCLVMVLQTTPSSIVHPLITRHSIAERRSASKSILVVEDNETNREVTQIMCKHLGIGCDTVADGASALEVLRSKDYDLVIMDCRMPDMDGFETTRRLRDPSSGIRNRHVPVIAMTADAQEEISTHCHDAGMNDYIAKPVSVVSLGMIIDKWLIHRNTLSLSATTERPADSVPNTPSGIPTAAIFDNARFLERIGHDTEIANQLITIFLRTSTENMTAIDTALQNNDLEKLTFNIHTIKGASLNLGADAFAQAATAMNAAAKNGDWGMIQKLHPQLQHQHALLIAYLRDNPIVNHPDKLDCQVQ